MVSQESLFFFYHATHNTTNQEYQGGDRTAEGADPEGGCPYHRRDEGWAEAFGL